MHQSDPAQEGDSDQPFAKKFKHTLDSDEEDDEQVRAKYDILQPDQIEGEEDGDLRQEDEICITPFNMNDEKEEGHFDKQGMFIFNKEEKEVKDHWLENIDWVKVKERAPVTKPETETPPAPELDTNECYRKILSFLQPGESVHKAIRRLGPKSSARSRDRTGAKSNSATGSSGGQESENKTKEQMLSLISLADQLISSGDMDAYELTYEQLTFRLNSVQKATASIVPNGDESRTDKKTVPDEVTWELKWSDSEEAEIHGPFSNEQMIQWRDAGYFENQALVRQKGRAGASFNSAKRIDFDLYS